MRPIAVAQTVPRRGDTTANLGEHLSLIEAAAQHDAQLIVFPELSLTGYELDLARDLAFREDDRRLTPLVDAARRHQLVVVVGAPALIKARLHLGAFILYPGGAVDIYTKRHLGAFSPEVNPNGPVPPAEDTVFDPGDLDPLVSMDEGTAAVAICADTGHSAHPKRASSRGAGIYLASMFVIPADVDADVVKLRGYASQHAMVVAFSNYGGPSGGLNSAGNTALWADDGERLAQLPGEGAGIVVGHRTAGGWRATTVRYG